MLSTRAIITEILRCLKEPAGLLTTDPQPHWSRAEILQRCNLAQEQITSELPGLLNVFDTSLTTTGAVGAYTIPATILRVLDVEVGGVSYPATSREALVSRAISGDIESTWESTLASTPYSWYVLGDKLYFYPAPSPVGTVITLRGELAITDITDSVASFPINATSASSYLSKAQKLLILLVVMECAKEDDRVSLYEMTRGEIHNPETGILTNLKNDWFVLRENPQESMITIKRSEG